MEKIALGRRRAHDGIYRPPKSTVHYDKKGWTQWQIRWALKLTNYNFKIVYRLGSRGGKPDALSRRPEYRPDEGARHSEQSILKSEHFQISIIH